MTQRRISTHELIYWSYNTLCHMHNRQNTLMLIEEKRNKRFILNNYNFIIRWVYTTCILWLRWTYNKLIRKNVKSYWYHMIVFSWLVVQHSNNKLQSQSLFPIYKYLIKIPKTGKHQICTAIVLFLSQIIKLSPLCSHWKNKSKLN